MSKTNLTAQLPPVRLTQDEKDKLQLLADEDNRTLSNFVRSILLGHINQVQLDVGVTRSLLDSETSPEPIAEALLPRTDSFEQTSTIVEDQSTPVNPSSGWTIGGDTSGEPSY